MSLILALIPRFPHRFIPRVLHTRRTPQRVFAASSPSIYPFSTSSPKPRKQNKLPASYYRGGTSRAIVFAARDLPRDKEVWMDIFIGVIGGGDGNGRQLDGMGGGVSSLSKVCVVGRSSIAIADIDYTFAAIGVRDNEVDFSSNCGNMTAAIGPYAFDHGLVDQDQSIETPSEEEEKRGEDWVHWDTAEEERLVTVRIHNTNTGKIIHSTFPVVDGEAASEGDFAIDGVKGTGARVELAFRDPAGSKTGKMLPTGNITDKFDGVKVTCIDVGNPCVFLSAKDLEIDGTILPDEMDVHPTLMKRLESIRRKAAVAMRLCSSESEVPGSIPKIAILSPASSHTLLSGAELQGESVDLVVRALSVGQPHRAVPITVAMAVAAAARMEGSVVHGIVRQEVIEESGITLGHPSGKIVVGSTWDEDGRLVETKVFRTARRLMEGNVYWKSTK